MERITPKMAAAFGVGFLGFIVAAYSYNQQHKHEYIHYSNDDKDKNDEYNGDNKDLEINDNKDSLENTKLKNNNTNIKTEISSFLEDIKEKKPNWGKFWKSEYQDMRNIKEEK